MSCDVECVVECVVRRECGMSRCAQSLKGIGRQSDEMVLKRV